MRLVRYLLQYRFRDMADFLRNERTPPRECDRSLRGKTAVISGATSGIGLETARLFASRGADLVCLNRSAEKSELLAKELKDRFGCRVRTILADFGSLAGTKDCARQLLALPEAIDILIHNAGVYHTTRTFTGDGIEMVFQVNHLAAFCLNYLLKEKLRKENRARVIYVNSEGYRFALAGVHWTDLGWRRHFYTGLKSYGAAKTAQLLTMRKFADFFAGSAVTVNAMHPGNVRTAIGENNGRLYRWFKKKMVLSTAGDPLVSAKALYFLAASGEVGGTSGVFFNLTSPERLLPHAVDPEAADAVWGKSLELCGLG